MVTAKSMLATGNRSRTGTLTDRHYRFFKRQVKAPSASDLKAVGIAGDDFVQDRVDEEAQDQTGDEAGDDDDGEGLLRVAADTGGHGGGEQTQAGDERGHHDRTQAEKGGFASGFADGAAFKAQFVDVTDKDDGGLHGDT